MESIEGVPHQPILFKLSIPGPPFSYVYHLLYAYPAFFLVAGDGQNTKLSKKR
jgi:hypothetical protein